MSMGSVSITSVGNQFQCLTTLTRVKITPSSFFFKLNKPSSLNLSSYVMCSSLLISFITLFWTCSNISIFPLFRRGLNLIPYYRNNMFKKYRKNQLKKILYKLTKKDTVVGWGFCEGLFELFSVKNVAD